VGEENNEAQTIKPLSVARLVLARDVIGREPVDAASSFRASEIERLYAFVELVNEAGVASAITVTFTPPGDAPPRRVVLRVGQKRRFRTWAYTKNPHIVGAWTVTVRELGGEALASASFEITP